MISARFVFLFVTIALVTGCGSAPTESPKAKLPTLPVVSANPSPVAAKVGEEAPKPRRRERPPQEKEKIAQLFQVPQLATGATNCPDPRLASPGSPPKIRLLGFSRMSATPQALVEIKGHVLAVEPGHVIDGVEVVAIDEESISFQYSGQRWSSRLFERRDDREVKLTVARPAESVSEASTSNEDSANVAAATN